MIRPHGGKSKSSRVVAAVVRATKTAALDAYDGLYVFDLEGKRRMRGNDAGREYSSHSRLCVKPTVRLNAIL
jgi:hypothetical protein